MDNGISDKLMELIPSLSSAQLQLVLETLTDLGVETWNNLRHVKESEFQTELKPVHARKLISSWNTVDKGDQPSCSSTERVSSSTSSNASSTDDWDFCFQIPWDLFPQDLFDVCKEGQRPLHRDRLQMIRIIVEEVHKTARNIKKRNWERIAESMVQKYPESFRDVVDGLVIGTGIQSLASQLMFRSGNIKSVSKNPNTAKNHGASNEISSDQSLVALQEELKSSYFLQDHDENKVMQQMKATYSLQRTDIDRKLLVSEIKAKWPFLFEEKCMF